MLMDLLVVMHWRRLVDDSIESIVLVGGVVDGTNGTIGLHERVLTLDSVAVACLVLRLDIAGVEVIHAVFESVFGRCLVQGKRNQVLARDPSYPSPYSELT